jgi:tetratricopeptide (TPR) repeat protein
VARELGERKTETDALISLGGVYMNLGEPEEAIESFQLAVELSRALGDSLREAQAYNNLGAQLRRLARTDAALGPYQTALDIFRERGDRSWQARTLNNLGYALLEPGTGLLHYALGTTRSFLWTVTARGVASYELPEITARGVGPPDPSRAHPLRPTPWGHAARRGARAGRPEGGAPLVQADQ